MSQAARRRIVWDFARGDVIDAESGEVIDRIYVMHRPTHATAPAEPGPVPEGWGWCPRGLVSSETAEWVRFMEEINRCRRFRAVGLTVDPGAMRRYLRSGRAQRVKVLVKPLSKNPPREVVKVMEEVIAKYPRLNSRTLRAKAAIAHALKELAEGRKPSPTALGKTYGLPTPSVNRLLKEVRNLPYLNELLREVRETLQSKKS